jgi:hypothetical protein
MKPDRERYAMQFVENGCQYYIAARFAMRAGLVPVVGNLFHHAIEHLLKGGLARKMDTDDLWGKDKPGHDLNKLWDSFKKEYPFKDMNAYDDTIQIINKLEDIRYPDSIIEQGMAFAAHWGLDDSHSYFSPTSSPKYLLSVGKIDSLIVDIFQHSSWNPKAFFQRYGDAIDVISYQNEHVQFFMPP